MGARRCASPGLANVPGRALLVAPSAAAIRGIPARFRQHRGSSTAGAPRLLLPADFQTTLIVISSSRPKIFCSSLQSGFLDACQSNSLPPNPDIPSSFPLDPLLTSPPEPL